MSRAKAEILKTANPAGWFWTFDRLDILDAAIDNTASAANANAALDAIKPLIAGMTGTLSKVTILVDSFEATS
jgi:hypothetical protein